MDANFVAIIVAMVAAAPGIYAVWRQVRVDKKKEPLDNLEKGIDLSNTAAQAIESYAREVTALRKELGTVRAQMEADRRKYSEELESIRRERNGDRELIARWKVGIGRLIGQLVSQNLVPVWQPEEKKNTGPLGRQE